MFGRQSLRELMRNNHAEIMRSQEISEGRWEAIQVEDKEHWERMLEETREFNREILLRNEKVCTAAIAEMEEGRRQIRANTEAVLRLLDRFDRPGESTA